MLVAEFLASDEAEDLSDRTAASRCADHIIDYGCSQDFGRPLRMSPAKAETFMLDWLPRKIMLSPPEQHAMPHVLAAWARWAGRRRELPREAIEETLDAVFNSMATFARVYHDPATFGLNAEIVARLLPDADLEALPRRAFAFPLLQGHYGGVDLGMLDPSQPQARRTLLAADHDDAHGRPANEQHISHHLALSDRLVIVLAGYTADMERFLRSNPGLSSRFSVRIGFPSYTPDELAKIAEVIAEQAGDSFDPDALPVLEEIFRQACDRGRIDELGNGRFARSLFERACAARDLRVAELGEQASAADLTIVTAADLTTAVTELAGEPGPQ